MDQIKKYYVARYWFDTLFRAESNRTFIEDLSKEPNFVEGNTGYALAKMGSQKIGDINILKGVFTKYKVRQEIQQYNKDDNDLLDVESDNLVEASINFFLNHDSHLIFIEKNSKLNENLFKIKFASIYAQATYHAVGDIGIDFLFEEKDVYAVLNSWDRILSADFKDLRPSNPRMDDSFKTIDQLLKDTGSRKVKLQLEANKESPKSTLNAESTLIREPLALASHGYGRGELKGTRGEVVESIKTDRYKKEISVDFMNPQTLTQAIKEIQQSLDAEI